MDNKYLIDALVSYNKVPLADLKEYNNRDGAGEVFFNRRRIEMGNFNPHMRKMSKKYITDKL